MAWTTFTSLIRATTGAEAVRATIGSIEAPVLFAGMGIQGAGCGRAGSGGLASKLAHLSSPADL